MATATAVKSEQTYNCDLRDWLKEVKRLEQLEQISGRLGPCPLGGGWG